MVRLLSVTSERMFTKNWLTDRPDMTIAVDWDVRHLTKPSSFFMGHHINSAKPDQALYYLLTECTFRI